MTDPARLFELPIEEIAERVTAARAIVQLVPPDGESTWMLAERVLAQELQIPVLQQSSPAVTRETRRTLVRSLFRRPPFAKYAGYLRSNVMSTKDPEPPDVDVPRTPWTYLRRAVFALLVVWSRSLTVAATCLWVEAGFHMRARERTPEPWEAIDRWRKGVEQAFSRLEEYGIHLKKVEDEFEWVGMSATPIGSFPNARRIVSHVFYGVLTTVAFLADVLVRIVIMVFQ